MAVPAWPVKDSAGRELRQWGNVVFPLDPQWEVAILNGVCVVRPKKWIDLEDYLEIRILDSAEFAGTPEQLQALAAQQVQHDFKTKSDRHPLSIELMKWTNLTQRTGPMMWMSGGVAKRENGDVSEIAVLAVMLGGRRADLIVGICEKPETSRQHIEAFTKFVGSLQQVSITAKPLLGDPIQGPLDGVYWGTYTRWTMGLDGMMALDVAHKRYTFFPEGRFYEDIPPEGVTDFDFAKLQPKHGDEVGNYYLANDKIHLRFADGHSDEMDYSKPPMISHGEAQLFKTEIPPDGFRFEGSRFWIFYSGFTPGVIQGGVSASNLTTFKKDGTYTIEASSSAAGSFPDGAGGTTGGFVVGSKNDANTGHYEVRGGRVFMTAKDGSKRDWTILFSSEEEKRVIWIGGEVLK